MEYREIIIDEANTFFSDKTTAANLILSILAN